MLQPIDLFLLYFPSALGVKSSHAGALVGEPLREKIMLIIYYRYCGSRVETLKVLAAAVSPGHWVNDLNALPEGMPIIRTDAYHAKWDIGKKGVEKHSSSKACVIS